MEFRRRELGLRQVFVGLCYRAGKLLERSRRMKPELLELSIYNAKMRQGFGFKFFFFFFFLFCVISRDYYTIDFK